MRFERRLRDGIRDGSISLALRRWQRPQVVAGRRYRTGEGLVEMDSVSVVNEAAIGEADARLAGYPSASALLDDVLGPPDLPLYRLTFHRLDDPDPRSVLAAQADLDVAAVAEIDRRLARIDRASKRGPWTVTVLRLIADRPAVRAPDLAASLGRETLPFKVDVRKLKALGLTLSLDVGYRLSPRGQAYLRTLDERGR